MTLTPSKINLFTLWKLPAAYFCGVRVKSISENDCTTMVRHRWINQNPFRSLFWAVQGMAAELATGALVMQSIKSSGQSVSMLLITAHGSFGKKANGKITFTCSDGLHFSAILQKALQSGEGQICKMYAEGRDENNVVVSQFHFEWSVKLRPNNF
jgi:Domain of unknown function (DUF4442)